VTAILRYYCPFFPKVRNSSGASLKTRERSPANSVYLTKSHVVRNTAQCWGNFAASGLGGGLRWCFVAYSVKIIPAPLQAESSDDSRHRDWTLLQTSRVGKRSAPEVSAAGAGRR
jgi:hypothetical protein